MRRSVFLKRLLALTPRDARGKVEAVFALGRAIKQAERGTGAPVKDSGVFLAMCEQVAMEWTLVARILNEESPVERAHADARGDA